MKKTKQSVQVTIHPSQFPEAVRRDLLDSLRKRQINHKFHYDSVKQTQQWLALHQAYSPSRTDPDCAATYERSFRAAAQRLGAPRVHLIGLGCGGGQKDTRLLRLLAGAGKEVCYTPSDVSIAMVLTAHLTVRKALPKIQSTPLVCDLGTTDDFRLVLEQGVPSAFRSAARVVTFFGMLPNFEPEVIMPRLAALLRPTDHLLLSANLAPGPRYDTGMRRVLPLYDNALTRDWLLMFLRDLGVDPTDGKVSFQIEFDGTQELPKRIVAYFRFHTHRAVAADEKRFSFIPGDRIRLFFSYRHTSAMVQELARRYGLKVLDQWMTRSGEEGVFLFRRAERGL
jgi:L-histidine N-alpha-methyltransferase